MTNSAPTFRRLAPPGAPGADTADELVALVATEARPRPDDRPWVMVNMIASIDGAVTVDGRSGGLGGPADKAMFRALRGVADVIVAGAGTVRTEGYGPPVLAEASRRRRADQGQSNVPALAVVTASAALDPGAALFAPDDGTTIVYTTNHADPERVLALDEVADVVVAGDASVEMARVMADLGLRRHHVVLVEGGPSLNGHLFASGLVDEVCLTVAPLLVGGDSPRITAGMTAPVTSMRLDRVLEADGALFLRYLRASA